MPNPNLTHIIGILDRSGSMESIRGDVIGGFNAFVADQQKQPGEATLSLVQFDNEYQKLYSSVPLKDVEPRTLDNYVPRGGTALLDAIGRTVVSEGEVLAALPEVERPGLVIVAIITDGQENGSKEYTRDMVREMLQRQQTKFSWQVTYLSADANAMKDAKAYGVNAGSVAVFQKGNVALATSGLSGSVARGRMAASKGVSAADAMAYTEDERDLMAAPGPSSSRRSAQIYPNLDSSDSDSSSRT